MNSEKELLIKVTALGEAMKLALKDAGFTKHNDILFKNSPYFIVITDRYFAIYKLATPTTKIDITNIGDISEAQVKRLIKPLFLQYANAEHNLKEIEEYFMNFYDKHLNYSND